MGEQVDARLNGDVAQLGEHLPCKQGVKSSNLSISICGLKVTEVMPIFTDCEQSVHVALARYGFSTRVQCVSKLPKFSC